MMFDVSFGSPWPWLIGALVVISLLYAWFNSPRKKGERGERRVARILADGLGDGYILLNDVYLPRKGGGTTQIDHIVVSKYGIFVIETKNYSGWIFANAKDAYWTQVLYREKNHFQNPLRQNYGHICAIAECLRIQKNLFENVVVFAGRGEFRTPMPEGVVMARDVVRYVKMFNEVLINPARVPEIAAAIEKWRATVGENPESSHVATLRARIEGRV